MRTPPAEESGAPSDDRAPGPKSVAFRFHARAVAALGRDLVTNDIVAVMELVKNSYDALASRVQVRVRNGSGNGGPTRIQVDDDGHGMDYVTIRDVWCVIATPFRSERPVSRMGSRTRSVTGEKGLGRLATARLGDTVDVITRTEGGPVLHFTVNWDKLLAANDLDDAGFEVSELPADAYDGDHGTCVSVSGLRSDWDDGKIDELRRHLARLVSPFANTADFSLRVHVENGRRASDDQPITPPAFMSRPKYAIEGQVDDQGNIAAHYRYRPIQGDDSRERKLRDEWAPIRAGAADASLFDPAGPECGPFRFEIRAWDLTQDDTRDLAAHFKETRSYIRDAIRSQQGISLYRDDVLVLPKSDSGRDWLDLDLRRVSRVGTRLSTSQIVGYVRITKRENPRILDTSDREGLVSNSASVAFEERLTRIVTLLEIERDTDRVKDAGRVTNLFARLSADALVERLERLRDRGGDVEEAVQAAQKFGDDLERNRAAIERRFGYYNRLAVIGTIAQMIIHEIRNLTAVIGRGLRKAEALAERARDEIAGQALRMASESVTALETLADRFAPLARRGYRSGHRTTVVEESINRCLAMQDAEIRSGDITVEVRPNTRTQVQIDPAELDAVVLNLVSNAVYWLRRHREKRQLGFRVRREPSRGRVTITVDDSGPGIDDADRDRVFWPGVTRKPGGIGMGLTVATEIVEGHHGKIRVTAPGRLGGATFDFDLPAVPKSSPDKPQRQRP
ncbi:MAG: sensor histidine kinase [Chloroflexi bacterium]|nr:sensor histidine kinase [Chloroflexota bacterium]